jgi:pilus assembly protein CpaF
MDVDILIQGEDGFRHLQRLQLDGTPLSIGRTPKCSVYLPSDTVSRLHALVYVDDHGCRVEDRSSNGTMVGEQLLRHQTLDVPFGTVMVVGEYAVSLGPPGSLGAGGSPAPSADAAAAWPAATASQHNPFGATGENPRIPRHELLALAGEAGAALAPWEAPTALGEPSYEPAPWESSSAPPTRSATRPAPTSQAPPTSNSQVPGSSLPALRPPPGSSLPGLAERRVAGATAPPAAKAVTATKTASSTSLSLEPQAIVSVTDEEREEEVRLRRDIHNKLLENLDLAKLDAAKLDDPSMRPRVLTALRRIVKQMDDRIDKAVDRNTLVGELADEALGLGPLERFLDDPTVSEVMVVDADTIYVEQGGRLTKTNSRFTDDERVRAFIERIITPLGRRLDESSPLVDARLRDGSRVNAIIKPLALRGTCITIRKFATVPLTAAKLVTYGALTESMARFLIRCVVARKNILISGGTGSGKTTMLNVLSGFIPSDERIVTIEDAAELQLPQPHVVPLESRPPNMEGRGEYTIRDLVRNALRMRPDRIVVGECRGGEALDMLQAMNTGHDGSLTTTHANSPEEALGRLETLALMAGLDLPARAIREQIASSIHVVVQTVRLSDGSRRISAIDEVIGMGDEGRIEMRPIFELVRTGTGEDGEVLAEHRATGYLPTFLGEFIVRNLVKRGEPYL